MASPQSPVADLSDPLQVAVKVTAFEGALALLSQQISQGLGNVQSQLSAMQGEMRETARKVADVAHTQHEFAAHSSGLDRLSKAIEAHVREFGEWRKTHETDNRTVSDHVTGFRSALKLIAWVGVFIVALVVFTVQLQFDGAARDRMRIEAAHAADLLRVEKELDRLRGQPAATGTPRTTRDTP